MRTKSKKKEILKLGEGIYRGIFAEVAVDIGVSHAAVRQGYKRRQAKYIKLILAKMSERKKMAVELQNLTGDIIVPKDTIEF